MTKENINPIYKTNHKLLINSKSIFHSVGELEEFLINFPNYKKSFNGARTINYTCKASNLKPNSPALMKNKDIRRNCTATIFYGYLKENSIWYIKRFNNHGKFCKYRFENSLDFNFEEVLRKATNIPGVNQSIDDSKHPPQKTLRKESTFDFFTHFFADQKNGILQKIGDFLIRRPEELRYEIVYSEIMRKLFEKVDLGINAYLGFNGINLFFSKDINGTKTQNLIDLKEFDIFTLNPEIQPNAILNFLKSFNLQNFFIANPKDFSKIVNKIYNSNVLIDNFAILAPSVSETYSWEYNFLNKNNKTFSMPTSFTKTNELLDTEIEGINYFFDMQNCKRMVFELKLYERKSRDIRDIVEGKSDEVFSKYSLQIFSYNGADRREIICSASFEINKKEILENVIGHILKGFINYANIYAKVEKIFDPRNINTSIKDEYKEFFNISTFIIPFNLKLIKILNKIEFPYFINTRSLTEYIFVLKEFDLKEKETNETTFNNKFINLRNKISNYYDTLNNYMKEKENPDGLHVKRKEILEELVVFEEEINLKTEIFKIPIESLFVTENTTEEGFTKHLYSLNNQAFLNNEDIILEKLRERNIQNFLSHNSQLTFSTFFELQWLLNCKNHEIQNEVKRLDSMEDLRKMKQSNYTTYLKLLDLNFNISLIEKNRLFIHINTDLRFIVRALAESIKAVPFYLPRNIYSKLITELFQYELNSRNNKTTENILLLNSTNNFIFQQIIGNIYALVLKRKIQILDEKNNIIDLDLIRDNLVSIEIEFAHNFSKTNIKQTDVGILEKNSKLLECSCKKYNIEFIPCFHLIMLISIFIDSHNSETIHNLIYDYISPVYSLIPEKKSIILVGIGKFDSQKLGRPRK